MESCLDMLVHMSFSSPAQTVTVTVIAYAIIWQNIQNTISCNYFCCCVIRTLYNIFRDDFTKKSTEICTTFFHLTLVNLNASLIFILAIIVTDTNNCSGCCSLYAYDLC